MLRLDAKLGGFCPSFLLGHFQEIGLAALLLGLKAEATSCGKVSRMSVDALTNVGESELTDEKEETCAEHKIAFTEQAIQ